MLQSLEPQRRLAAHLRGDVGRPRFRIPDHRHHHRTRLPTRQRRKRGTQNQAIGRSRGGVTTKIHLAVRGLGYSVRLLLTAGQVGDGSAGCRPARWRPGRVCHRRHRLRRRPHSPRRRTKNAPSPSSRTTHREPASILQCCFSKLKHFRRVATRFEKTAQNYLAVVTIAAAILWLR